MPGPSGEKGESGNVGTMVSTALNLSHSGSDIWDIISDILHFHYYFKIVSLDANIMLAKHIFGEMRTFVFNGL